HDADIIHRYRDPAYVLGGWAPVLAPLVLTEPAIVSVEKGGTATFEVKVAAIPDAQYQWYKGQTPLKNATEAALTISNVQAADAGTY
ncbi:MAG: immunoglobulin domain-containing protein, partial [Saprospiraceae bacterium]|nr:immunoglobulin domain-containing protein [Saprospiraceae bacterium]